MNEMVKSIILNTLMAVGVLTGMSFIYRNIKGNPTTVKIFADQEIAVENHETPSNSIDIEIVGTPSDTSDETIEEPE